MMVFFSMSPWLRMNHPQLCYKQCHILIARTQILWGFGRLKFTQAGIHCTSTQPRQLVPKMHIRHAASEKVDGLFLLVQDFGVLSFLMQQNLCVKSQEVWRTNIFFRGLRWKPACKLIETDSPDFKDKQKLRFVFFCLPHWPHGNCLLICCMPKWWYTIQAWWIITCFVLQFAVANDVSKTSMCNFRSPNHFFGVFFCETWIQALQVYHELLQLQDLQRQLQQMDNTAAQAWSFSGGDDNGKGDNDSTKGHDDRWYIFFSKGSRVSDVWWLVYIYIYKWF